MKSFKKMRGLIGICLILTGCNYSTSKLGSGTDSSESSAAALSSFQALQLNVFEPKCISCHGAGGSAAVDLSTYQSITSNHRLLIAGDAAGSLLYQEIASGDMPEDGPALSSTERDAVAHWIDAGAPNGNFTNGAPVPALPTPPPQNGSEPTKYTQLQTKLFDVSCVRCHSGAKPSGKVDLSNYQKIMTNKKQVVVPGKPGSSLAFTEIVDGNMPPKGVKIDPALVELLRTWITAGAKETE